MFQSLSLLPLLGIFAAAAAAIWIAGVRLSNTMEVLSQRFELGQALGGVILLAITASAAAADDIGVAVGNILGGIGIQIVVFVALDAFGVREKTSRSS